MTDVNRVESTTVANAETDARLAPTGPGAGGWVPAPWVPLVASVIGGTMTAVGALLVGGTAIALGPLGVIIGTALVGAGTGLLGYFGLKSAGPRSL
jgi:hypothetical protein